MRQCPFSNRLLLVCLVTSCFQNGTLSVLDPDPAVSGGAGGSSGGRVEAGGSGLGPGSGGTAGAPASGGELASAGDSGAPSGGLAPVEPAYPACAATPTGLELTPCNGGELPLDGSGSTELLDVALLASGRAVLAGRFPADTAARLGAPESSLDGGGEWALIVLAASGTRVERILRVSGPLGAMTAGEAERVWLASPDAVLELDMPIGTVRTRRTLREPVRRLTTRDGWLAAIGDKKVARWNAQGTELGSVEVDFAVSDAAWGVETGELVIVGARQQPGCGTQPALRRIDSAGVTIDRGWETALGDPSLLVICAETAIDRIVPSGADLVILAHSRGGNSVLGRSPRDLTVTAPLVTGGATETPFNVGSSQLGWVGRFERTGELTRARWLIPRTPGTPPERAASLVPTALTVDGQGDIHIAANSACCAPDRARSTIGGASPGTAPALEPVLLSLSGDLLERRWWSSWTESAAAVEPFAAAAALSARGDLILFAATRSAPGALLPTSSRAPLIADAGTNGVFLAVVRR